jgi:hypothetical protein
MKRIAKFLFIIYFILAKFHTKIKRWSLEYKTENRNKTYITGEIPDGFVLQVKNRSNTKAPTRLLRRLTPARYRTPSAPSGWFLSRNLTAKFGFRTVVSSVREN